MAITLTKFTEKSLENNVEKGFGYDSTNTYNDNNTDLKILLYFGTIDKLYALNIAPSSYTDNYTINSQSDLPIGSNKKIGTFLNTCRTVSVNFKITKLVGQWKEDKIVDDGDNSVSFIDDFKTICNPTYSERNGYQVITAVPEVWLKVNKNEAVYGIANITRSVDMTSPIINGNYTTFDYSVTVNELRNN